ncbi:unnamed protein product [Oikopleura dioica]|uniref:Uncharacterized protein n=1 Tax=Oikopleura dioica TaxID=34765 RepID=E4Z1C6_OIKDI|nr:unnamed protein product [Oikopleura dioica]
MFDEETHLLRSPKNSLIARAFSVFGTLLALIFILNILRFKNTLYYFGNQPLIFNGEGEALVRWQFTVSVALYSVVFFVAGLILIAQLCCAESWAGSRAFLLFFHFVFIVGNFLPPIFIIVWLASENSPSRYDHTRPGPTATGLCIASVIFGFLASGLMLISCCLIKFPNENNQQQEYIFDPDRTMRNLGNEGLTFGANNTSRNIQHPDVGYALSNSC